VALSQKCLKNLDLSCHVWIIILLNISALTVCVPPRGYPFPPGRLTCRYKNYLYYYSAWPWREVKLAAPPPLPPPNTTNSTKKSRVPINKARRGNIKACGQGVVF